MRTIKINNIFKKEKLRYKVAAILKLIIILGLFIFFFSNKPMYHVQNDFYLKRMAFVLIACFWMFLMSVCDIRFEQKIDRIITIIFGLIAPFMGWVLSEFLINEAECAVLPTPISQKEPLWIILALAIVILFDLLIIFLTNSIRVGSVLIVRL